MIPGALNRIYTLCEKNRSDLAVEIVNEVFTQPDENFFAAVDLSKLTPVVMMHILTASKRYRKLLTLARSQYASRLSALGFAQDAIDQALGIYDGDAGADARDAALGRVDAAASPEWKALALDALRYVALRRSTFTSDAVWWMLDYAEIISPREPRAMGAIFKRAERAKWCESTSRFEQTIRTSRHRSDVRVWRSLIVDGSLEDVPACPH